MLNLENYEPIGAGVERDCYLHPNYPDRVIKVSLRKKGQQTRREIKYFKKLVRKNLDHSNHLPNYYGTVATNYGRGAVFELIRDYDGKTSKSLHDYSKEYSIKAFCKQLADLKSYFFDHRIIFNYDLNSTNLLVRYTSKNEFHLVLIDGLGDVVAIPILNLSPVHVKNKMQRRWQRFEEELNETFSINH